MLTGFLHTHKIMIGYISCMRKTKIKLKITSRLHFTLSHQNRLHTAPRSCQIGFRLALAALHLKAVQTADEYIDKIFWFQKMLQSLLGFRGLYS